jgi:hypothetical protein
MSMISLNTWHMKRCEFQVLIAATFAWLSLAAPAPSRLVTLSPITRGWAKADSISN